MCHCDLWWPSGDPKGFKTKLASGGRGSGGPRDRQPGRLVSAFAGLQLCCGSEPHVNNMHNDMSSGMRNNKRSCGAACGAACAAACSIRAQYGPNIGQRWAHIGSNTWPNIGPNWALDGPISMGPVIFAINVKVLRRLVGPCFVWAQHGPSIEPQMGPVRAHMWFNIGPTWPKIGLYIYIYIYIYI
jgi:hypothetical protein